MYVRHNRGNTMSMHPSRESFQQNMQAKRQQSMRTNDIRQTTMLLLQKVHWNVLLGGNTQDNVKRRIREESKSCTSYRGRIPKNRTRNDTGSYVPRLYDMLFTRHHANSKEANESNMVPTREQPTIRCLLQRHQYRTTPI